MRERKRRQLRQPQHLVQCPACHQWFALVHRYPDPWDGPAHHLPPHVVGQAPGASGAPVVYANGHHSPTVQWCKRGHGKHWHHGKNVSQT